MFINKLLFIKDLHLSVEVLSILRLSFIRRVIFISESGATVFNVLACYHGLNSSDL